ncbi:MAG: CHASE domain-containing protein [Rhodoferax sp.]|nr:CHASE domain-containing protein [Rhodoferax sp.]
MPETIYRKLLRPWILGLGVAMAGVAASILLALQQSHVVRQIEQTRFSQAADVLTESLTHRIDSYTEIAFGLRGLFIINPNLDRRAFMDAITSLEVGTRHPEIKNIAFTRYVRAADKQQFEQRVRADTSVDPKGYPDFRIHPPGERAQYFVADYLWPMDGNRSVHGLDISAQPANLASMHYSQRSGKPVASGPFPLLQESSHPIGFVIRVPVFSKAPEFLGSVAVTLRVWDIIEQLKREGHLHGLQLHVLDLGPTYIPEAEDVKRPLFSQASDAKDKGHKDSYSRELSVHGRKWQLDFYSQESFLSGAEHTTPLLIGLLGSLVSLMLGALIFLLVRRHYSALDRAEASAEALRVQLQLQQELVAAHAAAESANVAKSRFLANMSHELRTPLNAVIGFTHLMLSSTNLSATEQKYLGIINTSGNHLLTLINDVLEISKIDAGRVERHDSATDIEQLVREVADMLRERAERVGLTLDVELAGLHKRLQVDAVKLRQVLINLLGNAIKFTQTGGVFLGVRGTPARNQTVQIDIAVRDTGIGIAPEDQRAVFEPFVQMVTHATSAGTGLGLTLTRQYLRMLGTELYLESTLGVGSCFRFSLTLSETMPVETPAQPVPSGQVLVGAQGKRILIADDDPAGRTLLHELLHPLGFVLAQAADGIEAVDQAQRFAPDLILMDWRMPRLDGLQATQQIRARTTTSPPKIVMLSASAFEEQRLEALQCRVDDFLRKPLQYEELCNTLERQLAIRIERQQTPKPPVTPVIPVAIDPQALAILTSAQRQALKVAAEELNPDKLHSVLAEVEPGHPALAHAIAGMAENFLYKELWELVCASDTP